MPYFFEDRTFKCPLLTKQCEYVGERPCKRPVTIGLDMCWQHHRAVYKVKVAPSRIEGGGKGLFALKEFKEGEFICPYGGERITHAEKERRYPDDTLGAYVESTKERDVNFDAACVRGLGSLSNGAADYENSNAYTFLRSVKKRKSVWLRASKRIQPGDEIINLYFPEYFEGDISSSKTYYVSPKRLKARSRKKSR